MSTIMTISGRVFDLANPEPGMIDTLDISHGLSKCCRFAGQVSQFYSVAQHAVLVSFLVPPEHAWEALHHDDTEAWYHDVTTPLKQLLPAYMDLEAKADRAVRLRFNLPMEMSPEVAEADFLAFVMEDRQLRGARYLDVKPDMKERMQALAIPNMQINPTDPERARIMWMNRYCDLMPR